jgi:KDO2-lipid IV(A) lauroyltransferase
MFMKKIKHMVLRPLLKAIDISFLCVFLLLRLIAYALPASAVYGIASALGYTLYYLMPGSRECLFNIVTKAMPDLKDSNHIKKIGRSSTIELYKTMFDLAVYARHRDRLIENAVIEGREYVDRADALGKGVIIASVHIGGWPLGIVAAPRMGIEATLIGINPDFTPTPRFVRAAYEFGVSLGSGELILTGRDTVGQSLEVLKQNKRLIFAADVIGEEIVDMFGLPTAIAGGMGRIACDSGAPIVPVYIFREKGPWKLRACFREPIQCIPSGDHAGDVKAITQAVMSSVESEIRQVPEQWTQWGALGGWWKKAEELKREQSPASPKGD